MIEPGQVEVVIVNVKTRETVAYSTLAVADLPDSFLVETRLEIAGRSWVVVEAEPPSKPEFSETGKVRITVAPVETVDPNTILFSLPTISEDLGESVGSSLPTDDYFQITEDDWRQTEFVAASFRSAIVEELADIDRVRLSAHGGYEEIHVRKRVPEPLLFEKLTLDRVRTLMPSDKVFKGVSFARQKGSIPESFSWTCSGMQVWGVADDEGAIALLCLYFLSAGELSGQQIERIASMANACGLIFVDWVSGQTIPSLD